MASKLMQGFACAGMLLAGTAFGDTITTVTTFDNGDQMGWEGSQGLGGSSFYTEEFGTPAPAYQTIFNNFGIQWQNTSELYVQDLTANTSVTISIDVKVNRIFFFSQDVTRPLLVEFRDQDVDEGGNPWHSVWYKFAEMSQAEHGDWTTFSVTFDPTSEALPAGWGGYGDEDPQTAEPILPASRTFAGILATYDTLAFSTYEPGWFYGATDFDIVVDNITITTSTDPVSCPADFDADGSKSVQDLLAYLSAFRARDATADFDGVEGITVQDLLAFLSAFRAGC